MTREEIDAMWKQANLEALMEAPWDGAHYRFAALVAEREREECAALCDDLLHRAATADECADAIRARKEGA